MSANEIVKKIETDALEVQTVSIPANLNESEEQISREQLSSALRIWGRGDERFVPSFVSSKIVKESGDEVFKEVLHYGKSSLADGSPNLQRTTLRGDNLMVTEYLAGPWFMAIAGFEERQDGELCFLLTTIRHKQHADYVSPADAALLAGAKKPPPSTEQNARRVLGIIRRLAENDEL
jgi:hypothetical protein